VSTDRPREKQAKILTEQNCKIAKDRLKEKTKRRRLPDYTSLWETTEKLDLCLGKKLLLSQLPWLSNLTAFQKETFMSGHKRLKSKMCQSK